MIIGDFGVYPLVCFFSKTLFTHSKNVAENHNLLALGIKWILLNGLCVKAHSMQYRINMLPIIDMYPTNLSCIYSTLNLPVYISLFYISQTSPKSFVSFVMIVTINPHCYVWPAPVAQSHRSSSLIKFQHCSYARWILYYDQFCWEHWGIFAWICFGNSTWVELWQSDSFPCFIK